MNNDNAPRNHTSRKVRIFLAVAALSVWGYVANQLWTVTSDNAGSNLPKQHISGSTPSNPVLLHGGLMFRADFRDPFNLFPPTDLSTPTVDPDTLHEIKPAVLPSAVQQLPLLPDLAGIIGSTAILKLGGSTVLANTGDTIAAGTSLSSVDRNRIVVSNDSGRFDVELNPDKNFILKKE